LQFFGIVFYNNSKIRIRLHVLLYYIIIKSSTKETQKIMKKNFYSYEDLITCGNGDLFGPGNAKLPLPPMLMFDRITEINEGTGEFNKGSLKAELDIKNDLWFFDCHFKADPVMPGCLGLDAMWQLVGFYLGWLGNPGKGRALGVSTVKFTGEVLQSVKNVRYEINMKKIMSPGGTTVGLANGLVFADDKKIYSAESLKVGLFK
jgi:3-hydroxyacyl-[acyl-carrier protein] dehydratase/trans-2-decenoyl-[acyl-carrier protein] isomerase